jgi:hypothetical protein
LRIPPLDDALLFVVVETLSPEGLSYRCQPSLQRTRWQE